MSLSRGLGGPEIHMVNSQAPAIRIGKISEMPTYLGLFRILGGDGRIYVRGKTWRPHWNQGFSSPENRTTVVQGVLEDRTLSIRIMDEVLRDDPVIETLDEKDIGEIFVG